MNQIIRMPKISEKASAMAADRKYVFVVAPDANAREVRKELKRIYKVEAASVHMIRTPGKMKRYGRVVSRRASEKKALVTLREGQSIDIATA
ncbi:MAG: 50S ribosomal protein L23 [Candidatus Liptonbacteria bacterium]|nr:50S ribosomal protein L23 [Candidatus Liptonbacteria bacterium]